MGATVEERRKPRKYDTLLLGAYGYTGSLTAEYIVQHFPTGLKWAIAGRSRSKLETLAKRLRDLEPERLQPEIEVISLDDRSQVDSIIKDTKVCISVVLYWQVGEVVVKSCIANGTDYIDVAGDIPLLQTFIEKYHEAAVNAGVALIHVCGAFTAPQDLLAWATARELAQKTSRTTKEVILSNTSLALSPSGGTVATMMAGSSFDPQAVQESKQPWALSPIKGTQLSTPTNALGIRRDPVLGLLAASSISAIQNQALVHRTWGLLQGTSQDYGPNFQYNEYNKVSSTIAGLLSMLETALLSAFLEVGPLRRIAKLFLPAPGDGPDIEKTRHDRVKFEAVAIADTYGDDNEPPRAYGSFSYPSGAYFVTALFLAEGAASLLYHRRLENDVAGGCLTPAFLGDDLLDRIRAAGATFQVNLV
ncbi:Saccharopine dehydrogenase-domain-containing protein [Hypoxylon trugodes]|uniref:Saccharopine dehydrogenase-domain-containing protein n=1 Tax=Hypoxylon trugodes TaxID=326681 RepID=UPI00218CDCD0|nr:Saccharopine dehydrogenase-domain-containing protein [Hypoxylon trugodes]KAI1390485.1 Saccharopine dehydrogenase-domain-containing protein [Hypoxylon trugodes]